VSEICHLISDDQTPFFSDRYDIIVGFTSLSTLPEMVMHELIKIMKNFTVNQQRDIWAVIENSLTSAQDVLPHSTITVVIQGEWHGGLQITWVAQPT